MDTPSRATTIRRARVPIITVFLLSLAGAILAFIGGGTGVSVVATLGIVGEDTPARRIAGVVRARVPILALLGPGSHTTSIGADIPRCALIPVITRFRIGNKLASK